jgi:hypothetical protein
MVVGDPATRAPITMASYTTWDMRFLLPSLVFTRCKLDAV